MTDFQPGWPCVPAQTGAPSVADRLSDPSADDLLPQILALTPRGPAWGTDEAGDGQGASPLMRLFWKAIAGWNAVSYAADFTLAVQAFPSAISWSLTDWEAELGLPDPCVGAAGDTAARIAAIRAKYAGQGGQSVNYFVCLALSLGEPVCAVEEFKAFRVGDRIGDRSAIDYARVGDGVGVRLASEDDPTLDRAARLYGPAWEYAFRLHADPVPITYARVGMRVGDRLAEWGNPVLECAILRAKPAQTTVLFAYDGCGSDRNWLLSDTGDPLLADDGTHLTPQ